ncbi:hypothetical protein BC936DRAFT_137141 [Jimgerdemannia flammicorona]|uniref:Uncharacterized protein n=1 Tax=Jimgerdemannia flammicorona TaxID=994334 RepID=A0A433CXZ3_9FUNG|nr:hypothetical protein BC936DRAFT_137141 [Jimgerdemannia flammicorona]
MDYEQESESASRSPLGEDPNTFYVRMTPELLRQMEVATAFRIQDPRVAFAEPDEDSEADREYEAQKARWRKL